MGGREDGGWRGRVYGEREEDLIVILVMMALRTGFTSCLFCFQER